MGETIHVFDFLKRAAAPIPLGMAVIFGSERFLQKLAMKQLIKCATGDSDPEFAATFLDSDNLTWVEVHDELATRSLFGGEAAKVVVIDHADKFVKEHRERLENYLNPPKVKTKTKGKSKPKTGQESKTNTGPGDNFDVKPSSEPVFHGLLVLVVDAWLSTTRLFKEVEKSGLQIKCEAPLQGRSKNRDDKRVGQWLIERAKDVYQFSLPSAGAQLVIDLTDGEFGRMDQELQKLTLYQQSDGTLSLDIIKQAVGGWKTQTTWEAIDAAADGDTAKALELLDRLLRGGEHPLALFGQISSSLRKYSTATEIVYRQLRNGNRPDIPGALKEAGFPFWGNELPLNESRLKRMGSKRASQIAQWLLEADLALKRSHSKEEMGRLVLEKLFVQLAD
jgi:DNA polymerase-3 subunit delta